MYSADKNKKLEPILVAYDHSGSTCSSHFYHRTVRNIVSQIDKYDVLLWNHLFRKSTPLELKTINENRQGSGGTAPLGVAKYCFDNNVTGHLILITDGQIPENEVKILDKYLANHALSITDMECYIIASDKHSKLDATVIAPFLVRFPHRVEVFKEGEDVKILVSNTTTYEEFLEIIRSINTIEEFTNKYEELFSGVVSKMLGKTKDDVIRDELLNLQKRLLCEMKQLPDNFNMNAFNNSFETKNIGQMLKLSQSINLYRNDQWPAMLFHLLRMCSGNLQSVYSLSALGSKFNPDRVHKEDVLIIVCISTWIIISIFQIFN